MDSEAQNSCIENMSDVRWSARIEALFREAIEVENAFRAISIRRQNLYRRIRLLVDTQNTDEPVTSHPRTETYADIIIAILEMTPTGSLSYDKLFNAIKTGPFRGRKIKSKKGFYSGLQQLATRGKIIRRNSVAYLPREHVPSVSGKKQRLDVGSGPVDRTCIPDDGCDHGEPTADPIDLDTSDAIAIDDLLPPLIRRGLRMKSLE